MTDAPTWRRNPWWIPPVFGRVPELEDHHLLVLQVVVVAMIFENYDLGLVNAALKQIAEDLGIAAGETGFYLGAVRLGGLGAFLIVPFADRIGRRRVLLGALVGMSAGTLATALSQTALQFTLAQVVARAFLLTSVAVCVVILAEEFPAPHRAWAIGMSMAVSGVGFGLGALLYAAVDVLPHGWRDLYLFGAAPLLLLPWFRRSLRETARFAAQAGASGDGARPAWFRPLVALARTHPRRAAVVGAAGLLSALGSIASYQYTSYFVQTVHGWQPWQFAALTLGGGALGIGGSVAGGHLADRFGRRIVGFASLALFPVFTSIFFLGPAWVLVAAFACHVFVSYSGDVTIKALSAELFPTSHRGASLGWLTLVQTVGWAVGLFLVGAWSDGTADIGPAVSGVSAAVAVAALCLLFLPETRARELEAISAEGSA